jgi:hypothetical protein
MTSRLRLRRFLYLNDAMTNEFLAQLEGGLFAEEQQTETTKQESGLGGGARLGPIQAEGRRSSGGQETAARTVQQVVEAAFSRLVGHLEAGDALQFLDGFDEAIWDQLRRGEAIEVEATLQVPTLFQLTGMAQSLEPVMDLLRATGETVDAEAEEGIESAATIANMFDELPVIAAPSGAPRFKFVAPLVPRYLRVDVAALEGEATVMGTIERVLHGNSTWSLLDSMGLGGLPRSIRRNFERDLRAIKELEGNVVRAPAAIMAPVAIYR